MLPAVPPLTPKVSVASILVLLAAKVPLVAVKASNTTVSISIGPVGTDSVGGGRTRSDLRNHRSGRKEAARANFALRERQSGIKLIGCTGSGLTEGRCARPGWPSFARLASTSCWAACNSSIRAAEFVTWFTLTEDPSC